MTRAFQAATISYLISTHITYHFTKIEYECATLHFEHHYIIISVDSVCDMCPFFEGRARVSGTSFLEILFHNVFHVSWKHNPEFVNLCL